MGRAYQNRKLAMAKTAAMKTSVYSKYSREIYVAAKAGGTDPAANLSLRSIIDRAKKDQVPSHVIEKAIDKAGSGVGEDFQTARYEGFGPGVPCCWWNVLPTMSTERLAMSGPLSPRERAKLVPRAQLPTCSTTPRFLFSGRRGGGA